MSDLDLDRVKSICFRYGIILKDFDMPNGDVVYAPTDFKIIDAYKCGPNRHKILTMLIPDKIYFNRRFPCMVHDWMYSYPKDAGMDYKEAADILFKINMDRVAKRQSKTGVGRFIAAPMNGLFYYFVSWFGKSSFVEGKKQS